MRTRPSLKRRGYDLRAVSSSPNMKFTIVFSTLLVAITAVSGLATPDVVSRTDVSVRYIES
jgi:hypothetical protein